MNVKFDKNYLIPGAFFLSAVYAVIVTLAIGEDLEDMIGWIATLALGWLVLSNLKEGSPREAVIQITVTTLIMVSICSWGILHLFFSSEERALEFLITLISSVAMVCMIWAISNRKRGTYRLMWLIEFVLSVILIISSVNLIIENSDDLMYETIGWGPVAFIGLLTVINLFDVKPGKVFSEGLNEDYYREVSVPSGMIPVTILFGTILFLAGGFGKSLESADTALLFLSLNAAPAVILVSLLYFTTTRKTRRASMKSLHILLFMLGLLWLFESLGLDSNLTLPIFPYWNMILFNITDDIMTAIIAGIIVSVMIMILSTIAYKSKKQGTADRVDLFISLLLSLILVSPLVLDNTIGYGIRSLIDGNTATSVLFLSFPLMFLGITALAITITPRPVPDTVPQPAIEEEPVEMEEEEQPADKPAPRQPEFHLFNSEQTNKIEDNAFNNCKTLKEMKIPDGITHIGRSAFYGCTALGSVYIPDSVVEIGEGAFYGCTALKRIELPKNLVTLGDNAFYGCTALGSVYIPDNIKHLGKNVFYGCTTLESVKETSEIPQETAKPIPVSNINNDDKKTNEPVNKKPAKGKNEEPIEEEIPEKKYDDDFSYDDLYGKDEPEADTDQKYHSCPSCGTELTALKKDFDRCPYCGEKLTTNDLDKPKNEGEN